MEIDEADVSGTSSLLYLFRRVALEKGEVEAPTASNDRPIDVFAMI